MSLAALFLFAAVATAPPPPAAPQSNLIEIDTDRTPMRCKPAPYYVADQDGPRMRAGRVFVTGSRVPMSARESAERRTRPCFLMRDPDAMRDFDSPPINPLRTAD